MNTLGFTLDLTAFFATEGGRKCPLCGRYARPGEVGDLSEWLCDGAGRRIARVSRYGHLPGYGCNKEKEAVA